jgi:hypothetical protein
MKDKDAQLMMEALRRVNEVMGDVAPAGLTVKQSGDFIALRREVDEYLTTSVHTTGAEDLKAYVLAIIDRYLGTGPIKRMHGKDNQAL